MKTTSVLMVSSVLLVALGFLVVHLLYGF